MDGMASMGMDMSSNGLFTGVNQAIALGYWYIIAGVVGIFTIVRTVSAIQGQLRRRAFERQPHGTPSKPVGVFTQAYATATAVMREISYSQPWYFTGKFTKYMSPLPIGRCLVLAIYWTMVLGLLWSNTLLQREDPMFAYKWEKVGYRAAWVSVTQIPFIYLLSCKFNLISLLTGISYERLNWLHRWTARTVFLTVVVHWSFFLREWWLADMIALELQMMPMVKYGVGAFAVIGWMVFSGFGYFRSAAYEFFVAQHICAAVVLLWLLYSHVPAYARYNIWMSVGLVAFDWGVRIATGFLRNIHLLKGSALRAPGYAIRLQPLSGDMVRLTIDDADFDWKAGQHVGLSMPWIRPFEMHPFTIANAMQHQPQAGTQAMTLLVKAQSGFSKSLHRAAVRSAETNNTYRAFLSGPWGIPPDILHFETVVLIACGSGASFIIPILEEVVGKQGCVRKVSLHWIIRVEEHFTWYNETLTPLVNSMRNSGMSLHVTIHVTQSAKLQAREMTDLPIARNEKGSGISVDLRSDSDSSTASLSTLGGADSPLSPKLRHSQPQHEAALEIKYGSRPTVGAMIRPPVEAAIGETAIVVCGGIAITAQVRTFVAALSDERGVHKGSGAQGMFLFTETYGW